MASAVVVAFVVVEFPVMTRLPLMVEEALERKPVRVESPPAESVVKDAAPAVNASAPMLIEPKFPVIEPESRAPVRTMLSWTAFGKVEEMDGMPPAEVMRTPLFAVAIEERVSAAEVYRSVLVPPKVVTPVPPLKTVSTPVVSERATPSVEVATRAYPEPVPRKISPNAGTAVRPVPPYR